MIERVTILLACLALIRGGTIRTNFSLENTVSNASYLINNVANNKAKSAPAPIYEEDVSKQETNYTSADGTQGGVVKSPNNSENFSTYINNDGATFTHTIPTISTQNIGTIAYNDPDVPLVAKTYLTPLITKTNGLTYNPQTSIIQNEAIKTITPYSNAPAVSHMSFAGLGTNYSW